MGAEVTLMRVVDAANGDWGERGAIGGGAETAVKSLYVEQAQAYLERVAEQLRALGVTTHLTVRQGHPAKQIVAAAKECGADAIAMATHSRRGINRLMFGSVTEAVLHETNLPILLVRAS